MYEVEGTLSLPSAKALPDLKLPSKVAENMVLVLLGHSMHIPIQIESQIKSGEGSFYINARMSSKNMARKVIFAGTLEGAVRTLKARFLITTF